MWRKRLSLLDCRGEYVMGSASPFGNNIKDLALSTESPWGTDASPVQLPRSQTGKVTSSEVADGLHSSTTRLDDWVWVVNVRAQAAAKGFPVCLAWWQACQAALTVDRICITWSDKVVGLRAQDDFFVTFFCLDWTYSILVKDHLHRMSVVGEISNPGVADGRPVAES